MPKYSAYKELSLYDSIVQLVFLQLTVHYSQSLLYFQNNKIFTLSLGYYQKRNLDIIE